MDMVDNQFWGEGTGYKKDPDKSGDLQVAEVAYTQWECSFRQMLQETSVLSLKFTRAGDWERALFFGVCNHAPLFWNWSSWKRPNQPSL